jgi:hypothetical protein
MLVRRLTVCILALAAASAPARTGTLDPPAGPVEPTMKTLSQVEPRTPINSTTTPGDDDSLYKIVASGSYYLTANVLFYDEFGIEIAPSARDVTIDLNGFAMQAAFLGMMQIGVHADARGLSDGGGVIHIRNGVIHDCEGGALEILDSRTITVEDVTIVRCGGSGMILGDNATVRRCVARGVGGFFPGDHAGIAVGADSMVEGCTVDGVSSPGFGPGACLRAGGNSIIRDCIVIQAATAPTGIETGGGCLIERNTIRCDTSIISFTGIAVNSASIIRGNLLTSLASGTHTGISCGGAGTIQDNMTSSFDTGVTIGSATDCVITRNHFRSAVTDVQATFPGSNIIGPTVGPGGAAASNNPHANYSN